MDDTATQTEGLGDAARAFLERRLAASEARLNAAPMGSVARAEASEEAREIRAILETDREALEKAVTAIARARTGAPIEDVCPSCSTLRLGSFRFCRSCGHDFEADGAPRRTSVEPKLIR